MFKKFLVLTFCFVFNVHTFSQQTASFTNSLVAFNQAKELYNNNQFLAAQSLFYTVKNNTERESIESDCAYYIANCAVRLNQQDADQLMQSFVDNYPTSVKRNAAFIDVANYYFENGKYAHAQKWYNKIDVSNLSRAEAARYNFNNGYAFFKAKQFTQAKKYLNKVIDSKTYGAQAKYYLGFIAYESDDYQEANDLFDEVKDNDRYNKDLSYYQADMNFKLGKFQEAINTGKEQFDRSSPKEKSELSKIIGESYFNLQNYAEAIPYLKAYKGKRGRWNNTDYYQLGYAYYKQNEFANAVNEFNKIVDGRNAVAQNAYYHLAESYLKQNKKQEALNAFKNASEMDFSTEIQEDAFFNYAKISYEIGNNYTSVPQVLTSFIEKYPKNKNNSLLKDLLIDSYMSSQNYKEALNLLENNNAFHNKLAYQKVAFYRGVEVYNEGSFEDAKSFFAKSLKEPRDPEFTARATYWDAESDFQLLNFDEAGLGYKQYMQLPQAASTPEYTNAAYNIGYNYFKQKQYETAITHFKSFVSKSTIDPARKNDAFLRLGDSYFVTSSYWPAIENYNEAIAGNTPDKDYAAFQKAISYGFVDKTASKIKELSDFTRKFPKSFYKDDALYELGNTYVSQDNTAAAIKTYNQLVDQHPKSSYVSKTMLKQALLFDNEGKSAQALTLFKKVASQYPSTPEALQAVASAKIIYIDQGQVDAYAAWVQTLDFISIEDAEVDDATFAAAEKSYLENNVGQAIKRFNAYLEQFPNGKNAVQAHFYVGQLYFGKAEMLASIPHFKFVLETDRNEFTEQALARISEVYLGEKEYEEALQYLTRLEVEADFPQNIIFAQTNSMKANYELQNFDTAVAYAEKVLQNAKIDTAIKSDAQIIIARSAIKTGDHKKAEAAYAEVAKIATGQLAAEALYYDAYYKNAATNFEASNAVVQQLAKEYSGYKLFGAKGLVLMAKNFYGLDDAYQATYILESVISNFAEFPEVVSNAQQELDIIKTAEAKTNSSVTSPEKN